MTGASDLRGSVVFVTGATGMLGYAVARALALAGARVRALSRGGALPEDLPSLGVEVVSGDLLDADALRRGVDGARFVFHVAADVRMWRGVWADVLRTNVDGTRALVEAAVAARPERFVFTSSGSTLGKPLDATRGEPVTIDERDRYSLAPLGMVYPHTKWLSEEEVLRGVDRGLDAVITHPTAIFGPFDLKRNLLPLFRAARSPLGLAVPRGYRTVCDVRDVADGHLAAALRGRRGERYALAGESMSVRDLFGEIAATVGGRPPRFELPAGVVVGAGRAMEALALLRRKAPTLSEEMAIQSTLRVKVSSDKAERELGYRSRAARVSIADTAAWYRDRGDLT
ncbi:Dihydroflavonol-4-reductase [Minicystis rosea]|nr:Dihydroflavonol-4-reductase [Minicystis rosea]